jgi:YebC/PmpR family DNA-binding regulatory protein
MGRAHEVRKVAMAKSSAQKTKQYSKYGKLVYQAAKTGGPDEKANPSLKRIIEKAKKEQIPADVIKRAIDKVKSGAGEDYIQVTYEVILGNGLLMVECLTDNVNRSISTLRAIVNKVRGKIASQNAVAFQFSHCGLLTLETEDIESVEMTLLELDIEILKTEVDDKYYSIYVNIADLYTLSSFIKTKLPNVKIDEEEIIYDPNETIELSGEELTTFELLLKLLDDSDDVDSYYHNVSFK